ncbi:MAG: SpoIVB peptidase [Halanaerobiaceae bacterium]
MRSGNKKRLGLIFLIISLLTVFTAVFLFNNWIPGTLSIVKDNEANIRLHFPLELYVEGQDESSIQINGKSPHGEPVRVDTASPVKFTAKETGHSYLNFKLFGLIPIRRVRVNVLPEVEVYPGGQAIGVLMRSEGVMVVGSSYVEGKDGKRQHPAREAGINVGDTILEIEGREVDDKLVLSSIIQEEAAGNSEISLLLRRQSGKEETVQVSPVRSYNGDYMIGLYVDDGVAGVGTLTFHEPGTEQYGALGHIITENNSQIEVDVREGKIVEAQISGINYGRRGLPGEKQGSFFQEENVLGNIQKNTEFGIYGNLKRTPDNPYFDSPIPVATISEVERGPAEVYTVIEGGEIERFEVNIEQISPQSRPDSRGMVVNITDPRLKESTGGIIQGMSGSPIVQNDKLVGAVTHVFVNNPGRGYGVFAEWMLLQTEIEAD